MGVNILKYDGRCPICDKQIDLITEFRDALSLKEYFVGGLCQRCQDKVFGNNEDIKTSQSNEINDGESIENKTQKVCAALDMIIKDVKSKLPKDVFDFNDFYIAGGCIYSIWNNKEPKDYDFFCTNKKALNKLQLYFETNKCNYISENAITYGKYQFITKWYGKPEQEVAKFDFKHNMFYYNIKGLHNLVDRKYLNDNKLVFNNLRSRDVVNVVTRIPKFVSRGMDISREECMEILDVMTKPTNYIKEKVYIKKNKSKAKKRHYDGY